MVCLYTVASCCSSTQTVKVATAHPANTNTIQKLWLDSRPRARCPFDDGTQNQHVASGMSVARLPDAIARFQYFKMSVIEWKPPVCCESQQPLTRFEGGTALVMHCLRGNV